MSLSETYSAGGASYMHPITLVFIANIVVILMVVLKVIQGKVVESKWIEAIKQLGGLALALGAFGTIIGFFFAFSDLSEMKDALPLNVIMGGCKVALITILYGFIVHCISLLVYILIKLFSKNPIV